VPYFGGGSPSSSAAKASVTPSSVAAGASQKPASSTSEPGQATVITSISPGKTVFITQTPVAQSSSPSDSKKGGGTNTAGVAVGVVVSIVVLSALTGAALFFYRRKQRRDAEMGHQQLDDFASPTSTKPMTFRPAPGPDARIDHDAMAQRRMSDGSIADNEDYSRRILKVRTIADELILDQD
jgi:cell wall integrity and stress response component